MRYKCHECDYTGVLTYMVTLITLLILLTRMMLIILITMYICSKTNPNNFNNPNIPAFSGYIASTTWRDRSLSARAAASRTAPKLACINIPKQV